MPRGGWPRTPERGPLRAVLQPRALAAPGAHLPQDGGACPTTAGGVRSEHTRTLQRALPPSRRHTHFPRHACISGPSVVCVRRPSLRHLPLADLPAGLARSHAPVPVDTRPSSATCPPPPLHSTLSHITRGAHRVRRRHHLARTTTRPTDAPGVLDITRVARAVQTAPRPRRHPTMARNGVLGWTSPVARVSRTLTAAAALASRTEHSSHGIHGG